DRDRDAVAVVALLRDADDAVGHREDGGAARRDEVDTVVGAAARAEAVADAGDLAERPAHGAGARADEAEVHVDRRRDAHAGAGGRGLLGLLLRDLLRRGGRIGVALQLRGLHLGGDDDGLRALFGEL